MPDLAEFLLARIAEDEADAQLTSRVLESPVQAHWLGADGTSTSSRWDPARVLAECAAKRLIIEERIEQNQSWGGTSDPDRDYDLRALAMPFATHPDYRQEWKP